MLSITQYWKQTLLTRQTDQGNNPKCKHYDYLVKCEPVYYERLPLVVVLNIPFLAVLDRVWEGLLQNHHSHAPANKNFNELFWKHFHTVQH